MNCAEYFFNFKNVIKLDDLVKPGVITAPRFLCIIQEALSHPFPEANLVTNNNNKERSHASNRGRRNGHGQNMKSYHDNLGHSGGHTHQDNHNYRGGLVSHFKGSSRRQKWQKNENYGKGDPGKKESICFQCRGRNN
ncbi:unnamed protein product [Cuscuta epithymum]|uniref:Uncharacterized protein n=1 Tax=Cuscuta epithymum TaxID=186058 RepID=A0AAV0EPW8_9ASTE|nr:unnamed protein product [Cuscuta epithymum]